jgi:proline iminopeptidase
MTDIMDYQRAMTYTNRQLYAELQSYDQREPRGELAIPVFFFQGERDIITPVSTVRAHLQHIRAPHAQFVTIPRAGHLAEFANPARVLHELLSRVRPHATSPTLRESQRLG